MTRYRFDQIAENSTAKKKPEESDRGRYVGLEHLDPGTLEVTRWGAEVTPKGDKLLMKKGDVLFGRRRAYQKKVGIAPFDGIFSAHGMVLRPKADVVDPMFFPFFISSDIFLDEAIRVSVGSLSPTANWKDLRTLEFDLPSPGKQRELAGILSEAESLKGHYRKMLTTCDDVVKSQFVEMFALQVDGEVVALRDCCASICGGKTPSMKHPEYYGGNVPFIKSGDVKDDSVSSGSLWLSDTALEEAGVKLIPQNSVLVVTRSALLQRKVSTAICNKTVAINQDIKAFIPNEEFGANYLLWAIRSHEQRLLAGVRSVSTSALDFDDLCSLPIKVASKERQQEFADFVAQVDKSKFAVQKALDELNATTKKILNQELGLGDV